MTETTAEKISGFKLMNNKMIKEINSEAFIYEHTQTGAKLLYLKNSDPNKAFSIAFRTPPVDNTGCPHILEHSVLNGSQRFPAKNTFTELVKGSMKTFLNAFTGSDKTMYPIASTNEQDFFNLMNVYLDAVLHPNIYNSADTLKQEGWHYELFSPDAEITYKGVVYNEMKGAFSSAEAILSRKIQQVQFPDTPYGLESGGDPQYIPELTWEEFKAFHQRFYHPSNSWIVVYGDLDIDKALTFIDKQYLNAYERTIPNSEIPLQKPFPEQIKVTESYPIGEDENPAGKNYMCLNFTVGTVLDVALTNAMSTLKQILMDSPASPLRLAIQQSNLCADNYASFDDSVLQPTFSIYCKHITDENIEPLTELIYKELRRIASEGIDKKLIEATINSREFVLREAEMNHFPKGLYYGFVSTRNWMQGGDPLSYLEFEPMLAEMRKGLSEPMFEHLIEEYLLKNTHSSRIILKPVKGLVKERDDKTRQKLAAYKASLSEQEITDLIKDNQRLQQWQSEPDKEEDIAKIPFISLKDIKKEAEALPLEVEESGSVTLLKHPVFTNGIVYLSAYFDIDHLSEEDLQWLSVFVSLAGSLDTQNYSFGDLSNEIDIYTGGIYVDYSFYNDNRNPEVLLPKLLLRSKSVYSKVEKMLELSAELAFRTRFEDAERISQLIKETKSRIQMSLIGYGHQVAIRRMLAQDSKLHRWNELTEGMQFYGFLCDLEKKMEQSPQAVLDKLQSLSEMLFTKKNLLISITSPQDDIKQVIKTLPVLTDCVKEHEYVKAEKPFTPVKKNEGIIAPVNVQFCAQGGNFIKLGFEYSGKMQVLTNILRNDYLMQELRVKGGAYGILVLFSRNGYMYFCSYRDPNLAETLQVYKDTAQYLKDFTCSERDFEKYIIGTMADFDMPLTPYLKGVNSDANYISKITQEQRQQQRDEVLSIRIADIKEYSALVEEVMKLHQIAVFGVESKIKDNKNLFDIIIPAVSG